MRLRCCEDEARALVIGSPQIEIARWKVAGAGVDPHDEYARSYWLPIIGPTSYLLAQTLAGALRNVREGQQRVAVPTIQLAEAVGIGASLSANSPLARSVARLVLFELATPLGGLLLVRNEWPLLTHSQHRRLPEWLSAQHQRDSMRIQSGAPRRADEGGRA
jgi:hypothetical protein